MKNKIQIAVLSALLFIGCATFRTQMGNFQNYAGKFLASTAMTVDAAMQGWAKWVVMGKATPSDEATVRAVYGEYQGAMAAATNAYNLAVVVSDPTVFSGPSNNLVAVQAKLTGTTSKLQIPH